MTYTQFGTGEKGVMTTIVPTLLALIVRRLVTLHRKGSRVLAQFRKSPFMQYPQVRPTLEKAMKPLGSSHKRDDTIE